MQNLSLSKRNNNQPEPQWYEYLSDYFGLSLDDGSKVRWWYEIHQDAPESNNLIICNAIKWASDPANGLRPEYKATLTDVVKWVKLFMAKHNAYAIKECNICNSTGYSDYYANWKKEWSVENYLKAYVIKVVCVCRHTDSETAILSKTMTETFKEKLRSNVI